MIKYFLFDLDNTLYLPDDGPLKEVDRLMTRYIMEKFNYEFEPARKLRKDYYRTYGTTMGGLMENYSLDPMDYLEYVHEVDDSFLPSQAPELKRTLSQIPFPKFIMTNSYEKYASKVIQALGISDIFEKIFDIVFMDFKNKVHGTSYTKVISYIDLDAVPENFIMFDDGWQFLAPAKKMGMTTVLVNPECTGNPDYHIPDIQHLDNILKCVI